MKPIPPIQKLKKLCLETKLSEAVIVIPRRSEYEAAARAIQKRLGALPICYDADVSQRFVERHHVIALGNLCTNTLIERLYYQWYTNVDLGYPGDGGHVVRSIHNPWGTGKNVILLGGSNDAGIEAATEKFLGAVGSRALQRGLEQRRRTHDRAEALYYEHVQVRWLMDIKLGRGLREEMESKPHYRGPICDGGFKYYFSGEEKYGRTYRRALLDRTRMDDPFETSHIWFWEPLALWDLLEESPIFSNKDRLIITNLFLQWVESHEGRNFAGFREDLHLGNLSQPHRTSPALACFFGGRYFKKYYGLKQTKAWFADARRYFASQMSSSKTIDEPEGCTAESLGCGGLMTYAFASGDFTCFENGTIREAADRVAMCCNNLGVMAAYADTQSFNSVPSDFFCRAAHYYKDGVYEFMARLKNPWRDHCKPVWREYDHPTPAFHTDVQPREPARLTGVQVAPLARVFWDTYRGNYTYPNYPKTIPYSKSFDKISFRNGFKPEDDYLLLDGVSGGVHGFADANSILEFTSKGRLLIVTGDLSYGYDNSSMAHHNAVTVLRNGEGELPPGFAALEEKHQSPRRGFTHTVLPNYNGVDWHRKITWSPDRHFLVIDELRVHKDGEYRFDCRWRTLGEPRLVGQNLIVDQQGVQLRIENRGALQLKLERDEFRGSYFAQWAKKKYQYADPILNILTQSIEGQYRRGDVVRFVNRIRVTVRRDSVRSRALQRGFAKRQPTHARAEAIYHQQNSPRLFKLWSFQAKGVIRDVQTTEQQISLALESCEVVALDLNGRFLWKNQVGSPVNSTAFGDIDGNGSTEIVAGDDIGCVQAYSASGRFLWKHQLPKLDSGNLWGLPTPRVVRVRCADLDGDGCDEIVAGVGNLCLHVLAGRPKRGWQALDWGRTAVHALPRQEGDGQELWRRFSWGTWNTFDFADLNGDGKLEIIGGPGMPPKAAASPGWILKYDGDVLAELDIDGWAGGLNAIAVGDFARDGRQLIALGTMKGYVRLFEPPKRMGEKLALKRGQVVVDHTSGHNATFALPPPRLLWERNLGELITGLISVADDANSGRGRQILVAASSTGYLLAFDPLGKKLWTRNLQSPISSLLSLGRLVAAACQSGDVTLFDLKGNTVANARLGHPIYRMAVLPSDGGNDQLLVATQGKRLLCLSL